MIGTSASAYVAPGITTTSTAAQQGSTYMVTSDSRGVLGTSNITTSGLNQMFGNVSTLQGNVAMLQSNVATLQTQMDRAFSGAAISMAAIPGYLPESKSFGVSAHYGSFNGQNAFGGSFMARVNENIVVDAGVGFGVGTGGGVGVLAVNSWVW